TVYTEYFVRGTQPTTTCDLHPTRSLFEKVAAAFGAGEKPVPPRVDETAPPPSPPAASSETDTMVQSPPTEPPKKKRGFWSRIFGFGRDSSKTDNRDSNKTD